MNVLVWLARALVFVVLLVLAVKNSGEVEVHFFLDSSWRLPLAVVIFGSLGVGAALGVLAMLPALVRRRRTAARKGAAAPALRGD